MVANNVEERDYHHSLVRVSKPSLCDDAGMEPSTPLHEFLGDEDLGAIERSNCSWEAVKAK